MCALSVLNNIKPLPEPCAANLLQADGSLYCKAVAQAVSSYLDQREAKALREKLTGMCVERNGLILPKAVADYIDKTHAEYASAFNHPWGSVELGTLAGPIDQ